MLARLFSKLLGRDDREAGPRDDREAAPKYRAVVNVQTTDREALDRAMRDAVRTVERGGLGYFV